MSKGIGRIWKEVEENIIKMYFIKTSNIKKPHI